MRSTPSHATPMLPPLRLASDLIDEVELDLASVQRDLVLVERAGLAAVAFAGVAVVGIVALLIVRGARRRRTAAESAAAGARRAEEEAAASAVRRAAAASSAAAAATATSDGLSSNGSITPPAGS